ncbi:MAG: DUF2270 domain-containing protein [Planctomycetota bacterium]|nr:DUF2270 domain-containing protein [Planctomycetota bacterium]
MELSDPAPDPAPRADYESTPLTRPEYIMAVVHLYRGELYRANSWRLRLDNTTNWAVLTTAGLLTFTFGEGVHSHWVLLMGMALISVFLVFESRRFRMWHVWRSRVRMIEENFYGPILRRDPESPEGNWGELVARDLFHPSFKITRLEAVRARLVRNYWALYAVLLLAWTVKLLMPTGSEEVLTLRDRLGAGLMPWWVPLLYIGIFLGVLLTVYLKAPPQPKNELDYWTSDKKPSEQASMMDT